MRKFIQTTIRPKKSMKNWNELENQHFTFIHALHASKFTHTYLIFSLTFEWKLCAQDIESVIKEVLLKYSFIELYYSRIGWFHDDKKINAVIAKNSAVWKKYGEKFMGINFQGSMFVLGIFQFNIHGIEFQYSFLWWYHLLNSPVYAVYMLYAVSNLQRQFGNFLKCQSVLLFTSNILSNINNEYFKCANIWFFNNQYEVNHIMILSENHLCRKF